MTGLSMYLSKFEEKLLNGELGEAKALAMKVLVAVGESLGAQEMIEIAHAHVSGISYFNIGDAGLEFINDLLMRGGRVEVFTSANPYMVLDGFLGVRYNDDVINKQLAIIEALNRLGISFYTCVPYNVRPPRYGEHLAWAESNAVLYSNSVLGSRSNKEGGPLALLAALVGRTYKSGIHLKSGRVPEVFIDVESPQRPVEKSFLGLMIGDLIGSKIPYVRGVKFNSNYELKAFLSSIGTSSNTAMVIMESVTPDYRELFISGDFKERLLITYSDLKKYVRSLRRELSGGRGLYLIGCPHLSYGELRSILMKLVSMASKARDHISFDDRELWITTHRLFLDGDAVNVLSKLSRYNVKVIGDGCAVVSRVDKLGVDYVVTDSIKAFNYVGKLSKLPVITVELDELIRWYFLGRSSEGI